MKKLLTRLYKYNQWRYNEMFSSFEKQDNYQQTIIDDSGLFFNDIFGTLKHNLAADYIWLGRITKISELKVPLNQLEKLQTLDLNDLIKLWQSNDEKVFNQLNFNYDQVKILLLDVNKNFQDLLEQNNEQWLEEEVEYLDSKGMMKTKDRLTALYHLINHHTHHIGQISTIYTQKYGRKDYFSIDFIYFK